MTTTPVNKAVQPDYSTAANATDYKNEIDGSVNMLKEQGFAFAPSEQDAPDMTVLLQSGSLIVAGVYTAVASQSTGTITAPSVNPRIDLVHIDRTTGTVGVATGSENASATIGNAVTYAPALPSGKLPIAFVALATDTTSITDTIIVDCRTAYQDYLSTNGSAANLTDIPGDVITTRGDVIIGDSSGDPSRLAVGSSGQVLTTDGTDVSWGDASGGMWELVSAATASNDTSIDFTGLTGDYDYKVTITNLRPVNNSTFYALSGTGATPTYGGMHTSASTQAQSDGTVGTGLYGDTTSGWQVTALRAPTSYYAADGEFMLINGANGSDTYSKALWKLVHTYSDGKTTTTYGGGVRADTTVITAIRFIMSAGNTSTGKFALYRRAR